MFLLVQYARVMHSIRRFLTRQGILQKLDNRAGSSGVALWLRSLFSVLDFHDFQTLDTPWWTLASGRKVREFLDSRPGARVVEWGSGASTVWLGKRSSEVWSIESDKQWGDMVSGSVPSHVHIVMPKIPRLSGSGGVRSNRMGFRHFDYTHYVNAIDSIPGNFDLIVIDGRAREACLDKALPRLSPQGMILFDNTNRRRYRKALRRHQNHIDVRSFTGVTPILMWPSRTSIIFLREDYAAIGVREPRESKALS